MTGLPDRKRYPDIPRQIDIGKQLIQSRTWRCFREPGNRTVNALSKGSLISKEKRQRKKTAVKIRAAVWFAMVVPTAATVQISDDCPTVVRIGSSLIRGPCPLDLSEVELLLDDWLAAAWPTPFRLFPDCELGVSAMQVAL